MNFLIVDVDTVSVDSAEEEDNPFTFYNIAKFVLLPKISSKKSFDVGALSDPKRNTLHDVLEMKRNKIKQEAKTEDENVKTEKSKDSKNTKQPKEESKNDKKNSKERPKLNKQNSQEPKPGNSNRRMSKK